MDNRFKVTDAMMEKAGTYIPLAKKEALVRLLARHCVRESWDINEDFDPIKTAKDEFAPPMWEEDGASKSRILLGVLLYWYFDVKLEDYLCPLDIYDGWMEAHIFNQIERFKAGPHKNKAFDLIGDYKDTEKRLNAAIYAIIKRRNDPVNRAMEMLARASDEETVAAAQKAVEDAKKDLTEFAKGAEKDG